MCAIVYRIFGRLVLVVFVQGESNPHGIEEQQAAENRLTKAFERASAATGMMVGFGRSVGYLCQTRNKELSMEMSREYPEMDDRCRKNYALLISFAEKVIKYMHSVSFCEYVNCVFFDKINPLTLSLFKFIILLSVYIKVKVNISLSDFVKEVRFSG